MVFLLVLQILIVAGLALTLIWFFIERSKRLAAAAAPEVNFSSINPAEPAIVPVGTVQAAPAPVIQAPPVAAAPAPDPGQTKALNDENSALRDKVQYLESRLMEYEIVQEEISTLGQLREQNEALRKQVIALGAQPAIVQTAAPVAEVSTPTPAPAPVAAPAPAAPAVETTVASAPAAAGQGQDQLDSILSQLDKLTEKPTGS